MVINMAMPRLVEKYRRMIGPIPDELAERINQYLYAGITGELIEAAIVDTCLAPRPSFRYLEAILGRCLAEGTLTLPDYLRRSAAHFLRKGRMSKPVSAQNYEQRLYSPEQLEGLTVDLVAEAQASR